MLEEPAVAKAVRGADDRLFTTAPLRLWTDPGADAAKVGLLRESKKVLVTGRVAAGRIEVVVDVEARWVTEGCLTDEKPDALDDADGARSSGRRDRCHVQQRHVRAQWGEPENCGRASSRVCQLSGDRDVRHLPG